MTPAPEAPGKPAAPRTWRPMVLWTAAILAAMGLAWFIGAVVAPLWQTHAALRKYINSPGSDWQGWSPKLDLTWWGSDYRRRAAIPVIDAFGGPERAARRLNLYARLPARVASKKEAAVFIMACCGECAMPALADLAWRRDTAAYACCGLAHIGPKAFGALEPALKSPDPDIRVWGAWSMAQIAPRSDEALSSLIGALGDPSWAVRSAAAEELGIMLRLSPPEEGFKLLLIQAMTSPNADARAAATEAILYGTDLWAKERQPNVRAFGPSLEKLLVDPDRRARCYAAAATWLMAHKLENAAAEIIRQSDDMEMNVKGRCLQRPYDGCRLYSELESDEVPFVAAHTLLRMRKSPASKGFPGFDAALKKALVLNKAASIKWKFTLPADEEPPE